MDNKRLLLATAICFAVLVGWQYLAEFMGWLPKREPAPQPAAEMPAAEQSAPQAPAAVETPLPAFAPAEGRVVTVETPLYRAEFHSGGGILKSFVLNKYRTTVEPDSPDFEMVGPAASAMSPMGVLINGQPSWNKGQWSFSGGDLLLEEGKSGTLIFEGLLDGIRIRREIGFNADNYLMNEKLSLGASGSSARVSWTLATGNLSGGNNYDLMSMAWDMGGSFSRETDAADLEKEGILKTGDIYWAGTMSNYFLAAVAPDKTENAIFKGRILPGGVWRAAVEMPAVNLAGGQTVSMNADWWFGPKDRTMLATAPDHLSQAVNFGMFSIIARPLLTILAFFHSFVGNWGIAILMLTFCIRVVFWPLSQKSFKSMEQMKKLQPMMKKLREKHKDDKEALNKEMMQLYKTYKVNPAGGCLPIVVQIPVFIGLYQALLNSIELRHASFIEYLPFTHITWLADLSAADPFYITPLLMGASMFLQQRLTPAAGDPTQQKVMMFMPVIFTVMFINFPAGLVIYWLCNNILSIGQQWWMLRKA